MNFKNYNNEKKQKNICNRVCICAFTLLSMTGSPQPSMAVVTRDAYPNMPIIAPIGVRIQKHIEVNESAKGLLSIPNGYCLQEPVKTCK
jgi:hypothetical protein